MAVKIVPHPTPPVSEQRCGRHPVYILRWRLFILFFPLAGPFLAPLFSWIGIWPFTAAARIVYFLGDLLCPLPAQSVMLSHYSTAVCPLCYGALAGLAVVVLSFPFRPAARQMWERVPWQGQLLFITCYLLPWLGDYVVNKIGLMLTPGWGMYLLGLPGGLAVGLLGYFAFGEVQDRQG